MNSIFIFDSPRELVGNDLLFINLQEGFVIASIDFEQIAAPATFKNELCISYTLFIHFAKIHT
jgi:hypothetical protein